MRIFYQFLILLLFHLPVFANNSNDKDVWIQECLESSKENVFSHYTSLGITLIEDKKMEAQKEYTTTFCNCSFKLSNEVEKLLKKQFPQKNQEQIDKILGDFFITKKGIKTLASCAQQAQAKMTPFIIA
jgi:hypothetical protein